MVARAALTKFFAASPCWLAAIFFLGDYVSPNPNAKGCHPLDTAPHLLSQKTFWTHHPTEFNVIFM